MHDFLYWYQFHVPCELVFVVIFFKTIIRFGSCDILNNQGVGKCYQPRPLARLITLASTWIIPVSLKPKPHPIIVENHLKFISFMVAFLCLFKKAANHVVIAACTQHIFGKKKTNKQTNKFTPNGGKKMTSSELLHFWKCDATPWRG